MKKHLFIGLISVLLLIVMFSIVMAIPNFTTAVSNGGAEVIVPSHAVELAPGLFSLGSAVDVNGEVVEGYMIIKKKDEASHRGGSSHLGDTTCYAFLAKGAKWKTTEQYVLDTTNSDGLSDSFVADSVEVSFNAWDDQVAFDVFGTRNTSLIVNGADILSPDGKNEVLFGSILDPRVIAVAIVWGVFSGPTFNRKIVEFDVVYNDPDFVWGDATINPNVMDFLNIATHEKGHTAGMAHPSDSCTEETMYRFAGIGETKKRTLNSGDIAGIKKLYD
ncbi:MAG: matrixin family metalloprotease [Nanoarchaeota archaeon]